MACKRKYLHYIDFIHEFKILCILTYDWGLRDKITLKCAYLFVQYGFNAIFGILMRLEMFFVR